MLVQRLAVYLRSPFLLVDRPDGQVAAIHVSDVPTLLFVSEVGKRFDSYSCSGGPSTQVPSATSSPSHQIFGW